MKDVMGGKGSMPEDFGEFICNFNWGT